MAESPITPNKVEVIVDKPDSSGSPVAVPDVEEKSPRYVFLRMNIFDVSEVDTRLQTFQATFYYELAWEVKLPLSDEDKNFNPTVHFANCVSVISEVQIPDATEANYCASGRPMHCKRYKVCARFLEQYELSNFPFDVQDFQIKFRTDLKASEMVIVNNTFLPSISNVGQFTTSNEFTFENCLFVRSEISASARASFSSIVFRFKAHRLPGFVTNNVFIPILIMSGLGLTCFIEDDFSSRFGVNGSLLLTLVAYKFATSSNLPAVNYLTLADRYVLFAVFLQVALVTWSAILVVFIPMAHRRTADTIMLGLFSATWIAWLVSSVALFYTKMMKLGLRKKAEPFPRTCWTGFWYWVVDIVDKKVPIQTELDTLEAGENCNWELVPLEGRYKPAKVEDNAIRSAFRCLCCCTHILEKHKYHVQSSQLNESENKLSRKVSYVKYDKDSNRHIELA